MIAKWALALSAFGLSLLCAEGILRAIDFSFYLYPTEVRFGAPNLKRLTSPYKVDPDLFWVPKSYDATLREARAESPSIAFMGDSCTLYGHYDEALVELLRSGETPREISTVNLAVGGWSSHQGLRQLERDVLPISPEIITIYYGWNDHWVGFGVEDKDVSWMNASPFFKLMQVSRLAQLASKAFVSVRGGQAFSSAPSEKAEWPLRVSPEDFRENLTEMVRVARDHGIAPVLLTAPTSHEVGQEPRRLLDRHLKRLADLVPLHRQYVNIVREVASEEGAALCDLASEFEKLPRRGEYLLEDGIHLGPLADPYIAKLLYQCFEDYDLLEKLDAGASRGEGGNAEPQSRWAECVEPGETPFGSGLSAAQSPERYERSDLC